METARTISLEKIEVAVRANICWELLDNHQTEGIEDEMGKELAIRLWSFFIAMPQSRIQIHEKWPKTWIDAFKDRWFPKWALRKWPVQFGRIDVDQRIYGNICPHVTFPDYTQKHIVFLSDPVKSIEEWESMYPMADPPERMMEEGEDGT